MDVACVTAKHEHRTAVHIGRMMISRSWWSARRERSAPRFVLDIEPYQIVQHTFAIVAAKHIDGIFVRDYGVLAAPRPNKLIAFEHSFPLQNRFRGREIERQRILASARRR